MKMLPRYFAVFLSLLFAASVPFTLRAQEPAKTPSVSTGKPPTKAKLKPPLLRFREFSTKITGQAYLVLVFDVTNPNSVPLPYSGYTADSFSPPLSDEKISPIYRVETQHNDKWKPKDIGFCKFGQGPVSLPPKKTKTFTVIIAEKGWERFKVGLTWFPSEKGENPTVAWSVPLTPKDIEKR
jgi:hypothetical protein